MKILRQQNNAGIYSAMVSGNYCCDPMRMMRGTFSFNSEGVYTLRSEVQCTTERVRFCPFCGEVFEIEKEKIRA